MNVALWSTRREYLNNFFTFNHASKSNTNIKYTGYKFFTRQLFNFLLKNIIYLGLHKFRIQVKWLSQSIYLKQNLCCPLRIIIAENILLNKLCFNCITATQILKAKKSLGHVTWSNNRRIHYSKIVY